MKNESNIRLIDGTFKVEDGAEILHTILDHKIKFHNIQLLATSERNCDDVYNSEKRLKELLAEKDELVKLLGHLGGNDTKIRIKSNISIEVVEELVAG